MNNQHIDKIIEITRAKKIGKSWMGHCPVHDDNNPSLSINQSSSGKVLVKCHSGCEQKSIIDTLKSLNVWPSEEFKPVYQKSEYYYTETLTALQKLKIVRIDKTDDKKSIFQQSLVGNKWIHGGTNSALHPYRFIQWRDRNGIVFVVEGEKCVHAIEKYNLIGTTFVGGAGGWKPHYAEFFKNRDVVILPDNDPPGFKFAQDVATGIQSLVSSIKVVLLPGLEESEDIYDWIQKGNTLSQLESIVSETQDFSIGKIESEAEWKSPQPLDMPEPTPINLDCLPEPLRSFVLELSASTETPTDLSATIALGVISLAAATSYKVEIKSEYVEPLNLFLISALESGNRKTSVMKNCLEPLIAYEAKERELQLHSILEAKSKKRNQDAELSNLRKKLGAKNGTPQVSILDRIKEIEQNPIEVPKFTRFICSDTTPEALACVMAENNETVGIFSDEGGIFQILAGRYSGHVPNLDLILKSHIGSSHRVDRKNAEPIFLNEPLISITLSPQPSVIKSMSQTPEFRDRGLFARFLFTIPQSPLGKRTGETLPMSEGTKLAYCNLISRLLDKRKQGRDRVVLKLSDSAYLIWQDMWKRIESTLIKGGLLNNAKDWGSKLPGHLARIAAIFHCIENIDALPKNNIISSSTMLRVEMMMSSLISHAIYAFDILKPDSGRVLAAKILDWIKDQSLCEFTQRDCHYRFKSTVESVNEIISALEILTLHNFIRLKPQDQVNHRPSITFEVNPLEINL